MTLLYFADTRFPIERANGLQTMATCRALAARGHRVTLVVRPDTALVRRDPFEFYGLPPAPGLDITVVPTGGGARASRLRFLLAAAALAGRRREALIYTRDLGIAAFLLQLPLVRRPIVIYESHGLAPVVAAEMPALLGKPDLTPTAGKLHRLDRRERRVWTRAHAYVTITRALQDELTARYGPRSRVFVVPDGAEPVHGRPTVHGPGSAVPAPRAAPPTAAYAGHLYPWKGVDVFVRALGIARGVRGMIVGGHPQESDRARVERLAAECGVADRLEITGLLPRADVAARLTRADMLVLPNTASAISARYTSPLKLFEYLWLGKPIVVSDLAALREVLGDDAACFVPAGDAQALAHAMTALAADPERSRALGAAALALAPAYSWEARAARLEPVLAAAVDAGARR